MIMLHLLQLMLMMTMMGCSDHDIMMACMMFNILFMIYFVVWDVDFTIAVDGNN